MVDRIGNEIKVGDRVLVWLPDANVIGFVSEAKETSVVAQVRGNGVMQAPGRLLVSFVLALPVDPDANAVGQVVKVHDPAADAASVTQAGPELLKGRSDPPQTN